MMSGVPPLHLAVALDGAGWHPAAWRERLARPAELFSPGYWVDLVREAELGLLDFVTIEDSLGLQSSIDGGPDGRVDRVRGRLDAVLVAARVAPLTRHVGLVPTATVTHTEPFHISKAIATLDYVSTGRAGWRVQVSTRTDEAAHFGRRTVALVDDLFDEAADYVEVVRRLWDSWEDDAEIRDAATGRFIDRDKLHYVDFEGTGFSVKGPSITPRSPQGQPLVTALAHGTIAYRLAARATDIVFVTPFDIEQAVAIVREIRAEEAIVREIRAEQASAGRERDPVQVFGELVVFLDATTERAVARRARLDALADGSAALASTASTAGGSPALASTAGGEFTSDAMVFAGTPAALADLLLQWRHAGLSGFRLRPGTIPHDLTAITRGLVPELQARGAFRRAYQQDSLHGLLGLPRPANRYATA
jgi:alkanesulfonate monooxygenase SsuD/methylene tetrahydromethanopterin reductase-like flavin-dependent oxidoreductase (luciferase family)